MCRRNQSQNIHILFLLHAVLFFYIQYNFKALEKHIQRAAMAAAVARFRTYSTE